MRDEYTEAVRASGFEEVRMIDETSFPMECMVNDPTAKAVMENLGIPSEMMKDIENLVISIKVSGIKPRK